MWPGGAKGLFPSSKFRPSIKHQPNVVYKIPCAAGEWCYIGETGRCFETRKKEHVRNVKTCANGSNIAKHAWSFDLRIDFDNSSVFDKGSFRGIIKTLEAWRTSATKHADNYSKPILTNSILVKQKSPDSYALILCFCSFYCFHFASSCIYFVILHFIFIRRRL